MTSYNEEIHRAFPNGFGSKAQDDFLTANGFPADPTINDRWMNFLTAQGFTTGDLNERQMAYFAAQP